MEPNRSRLPRVGAAILAAAAVVCWGLYFVSSESPPRAAPLPPAAAQVTGQIAAQVTAFEPGSPVDAGLTQGRAAPNPSSGPGGSYGDPAGGPDRERAAVALSAGPPNSLSIPGRADIPVVDATVREGVLEPPAGDIGTVGIWRGGAPLESESGTTLIAGHVNYVGQGNGAFFGLAGVRVGDRITTTGPGAVVAGWRVTEVQVTAKTVGVDQDALAGPDGARRLVLVTCGGAFDDAASGYEDNVYVWAVPDIAL